jgi:beta-phosphoglucomutase-like phosphatase (HAD superfamily)
LVIFDCNGVLVDSEPIASVVLASAFSRVGVTLTPETVAREFHGRRTADIFAAVEKTTKRSLPPNFAALLRRRCGVSATSCNLFPTPPMR